MEPLTLIKINSQGALVESWQFFLTGQGFYDGPVDGNFTGEVKDATIEFQKKNDLQPDGIVGNKTFGVAMHLGFEGIKDDSVDKSGANFPTPPPFPPLVTNEQRTPIFGKFTFVAAPIPGNKENIRITDNWESQNIKIVSIPQLTHVKGSDKVQFHKLAANQLTKLWKDWEEAGLLPLVLSWGGSFVPRFVRGSATTLSNHSFGTAFDINMDFNKRGALPALVSQKGCVRELVQIANNNAFFWGGHFKNKDGMHFEIAKIL
ncbi:Putative peptidoglycan binding domain-containing protein [Chitinophaga sp. CF118]|uniref:M15 family metallopeptidase n=1 Tax=Chitinophaga sp. CF118 TaxID=1884367 RepID=UPI0008E9233C|nr:M15 family metallopeptidase [Chitinophaga sp. CF118]SFD98070.1 Putative peptidoglycan binding domain-containing protein [Chitinophaga sp. CF118]